MRNEPKDSAGKKCNWMTNDSIFVVCISTRPIGLSKYGTTFKNIQQYYTPKRRIRYIYYTLNHLGEMCLLSRCSASNCMLINFTSSVELQEMKEMFCKVLFAIFIVQVMMKAFINGGGRNSKRYLSQCVLYLKGIKCEFHLHQNIFTWHFLLIR